MDIAALAFKISFGPLAYLPGGEINALPQLNFVQPLIC